MRPPTFTPMRLAFAFLLPTVVACSRPTRTDIASEPSSTPSPSMVSSDAPPTPQASAAASDAPSATPASAASAPEPTEAAVAQRSGDPWPFKRWDRAETLSFNRGIDGPNFDLFFRYHAYDDKGWSPSVKNRKSLTKAQALEAMQLVVATEGDVRVSACPEPEHAVVFFKGNTPVGSVNVSFACGDILLWPEWAPEVSLHDSQMTEKQWEDETARRARQAPVYEKTLQAWKTFFRGFGHSIETPPL